MSLLSPQTATRNKLTKSLHKKRIINSYFIYIQLFESSITWVNTWIKYCGDVGRMNRIWREKSELEAGGLRPLGCPVFQSMNNGSHGYWGTFTGHVIGPTCYYDVIDIHLLPSGAIAPLSNKRKINVVIINKSVLYDKKFSILLWLLHYHLIFIGQ